MAGAKEQSGERVGGPPQPRGMMRSIKKKKNWAKTGIKVAKHQR